MRHFVGLFIAPVVLLPSIPGVAQADSHDVLSRLPLWMSLAAGSAIGLGFGLLNRKRS